jgi:hypothetical protein
MAHPAAVRRKLFMHPAHRTVGVSNAGIAQPPYGRIENYPTRSLDVNPARVVLAPNRRSDDAHAAIQLFERAIRRRQDLRCHRVDLEALGAKSSTWTAADCFVVFGQGLFIAQRRVLLDAFPAADDSQQAIGDPMKVEIAATAAWHPVLDGVEPFVSRQTVPHSIGIPAEATVLLTARNAAGDAQPVAWIEHRHGTVFRTTLGSAEDFGQPDFVRLALNAVTWLVR